MPLRLCFGLARWDVVNGREAFSFEGCSSICFAPEQERSWRRLLHQTCAFFEVGCEEKARLRRLHFRCELLSEGPLRDCYYYLSMADAAWGDLRYSWTKTKVVYYSAIPCLHNGIRRCIMAYRVTALNDD